ncbi:MAG TPA: hypothetical protein VNF04_16600 [Stellaceae bacterium]|nr:hypothetical protein [Stellaceae bacterium]
MRYTKIALLIFGLGLVSGFVIVVGEFARLGPVASVLMALGLAALPVGLVADRGVAIRAWFAAHFSRRKGKTTRRKARPAAARRKPPPKSPARAARGKRSTPKRS